MIGYQDPNQGNQRRKQLAQYLKQQSAQRAQGASKLAGANMSALGGRSGGIGQPFLKGGSKATPEKFAFANMKPSLKSLLGLVGRDLGNGGSLPFSLYGPDTPIGGLSWGGGLPDAPQTSPAMGGGMGGPAAGYPDFSAGFPTFQADPSAGIYQPEYGPQATAPNFATGFEGSLPSWVSSNGFKPTPILGDLLYGDMFQVY